MEGCRSVDCGKITKSIWNLVIKRMIWLSRTPIPGRLNREVHKEPRKVELRIDWKLNIIVFQNMLKHF